jgi:hypothetical protein
MDSAASSTPRNRPFARRVLALLWVAAMGAGAACTDTPHEPGLGVLPSHTVLAAEGETYTAVTKNGKRKVYRVRVDRARKAVELRTVSNVASYEPAIDNCPAGDVDCTPFGGGGDPWASGSGELEISGTDSARIIVEQPFDAALSAEYGGWICPPWKEDAHFEWKGHHFQTEGMARLIRRLPSAIGVPKGEYLLPPGPWTSDDGRARIWSGTLHGTCWVRQESALGGLITVYAGFIGWYRFVGDYQELPEDVPGGGSSGGGGGGGEGNVETGDEEADRVIEEWLRTGECTPGWAIIVDGERVC